MKLENQIIHGDCLKVLKTLSSESINMCITSPPYWALRDYGVEGQLGLESTFQEYINKLCDIFDEVKRILKNDGTCWVNLGDTYSGNKTGNTLPAGFEGNRIKKNNRVNSKDFIKKKCIDIKEKSLCMIPQRFAIEMINRGWILRNVIIWHKPSCMPASVKDRFTVDFEYMYFFVKNKKYYFEQQFEYTQAENIEPRMKKEIRQEYNKKYKNTGVKRTMERNKRTTWSINAEPFSDAHFAVYPPRLIETPIKAGCPIDGIVLDLFMGSGTTALTAKKLQRHFLGIELNKEYIKIAEKRLEEVALLL